MKLKGGRLGAEARRSVSVARNIGSRVASASVGQLRCGVRAEAAWHGGHQRRRAVASGGSGRRQPRAALSGDDGQTRW
jgi:hypothetical protein